MSSLSRRGFLRQGAFATTGLFATLYTGNQWLLAAPATDVLETISRTLTRTWGDTLLRLQVKDRAHPHYGAIIYPAENIVHGRIGDTIYPFLHLAAVTGNSAYVDAAVLLYRWMERTVSQDDGSWLNELKKGSWKGTTVFTAIALADAVKHHGHLLDNTFKQEITARLKKSGDFIHQTFSIEYGNINYPIAAAYGLSLLGEVLDISTFRSKGKELARQALPFITKKDGLLSGEGQPYHTPSAKGCLSVDLGYNVEESLPSLVLYGLLTKDTEVLEAVTRLLEVHMEFMLPDGAWDNSWGTRNYKWTYWGSRTSDGCQPAYALMADRNPAFHKVALKNTMLLQACTHDGILYGGPHYRSHGVPASLHHTFCHLKALVTILDHGIPAAAAGSSMLPREKAYGSRFFSDIQTGLISKGKFRATVTAYDRNYKHFQNGHASGGAISMLWHEEAGPVLAASMNEYQLYEAGNMQVDNDPLSMPLTPRIELTENGRAYMNIADFSAGLFLSEEGDTIVAHTTSKLVDKDQQAPPSGGINCEITYRFTVDKVTLHFKHDDTSGRPVKIIIPVITPSTESFALSGKTVTIQREGSPLRISADKQLHIMPTTGKRVFNFVPGLEALPLLVLENEVVVEINI